MSQGTYKAKGLVALTFWPDPLVTVGNCSRTGSAIA